MDKVLLVQGYYSRYSWGFPKGKINRNEKDVDCAIREVHEEIGLDLTGKINADHFIELIIKGESLKLFVVTGISEGIKFSTNTRKEIKDIKWHDIRRITRDSSKYYNVFPFINFYRNQFKKKSPIILSKNLNVETPLKCSEVVNLQKNDSKSDMCNFSFNTEEIIAAI